MMEIDGHTRNNKSKKKRKDRKTNSDSHITWHKSEEYLDLTEADTQIQSEQYGKLDDHIKKKKKKEKVKLSEYDEGYPTREKVLESTNINQIMEDPCQMSFNTKKRKLSDCEDEEALISEEVLELNNEIHKKLNKKKRKKKHSDYSQDIIESLLPNYQTLEATYKVSPKKKKKKKVSVSDEKNSLSDAISSSNIMEANASPQHQIMCKADVQIKKKKYSKKKKGSDNDEDEIHFQYDHHEHPQFHLERDGNIEFTDNHKSTEGGLQFSALETEDDDFDDDFSDDAYEKSVRRKGNKTEKVIIQPEKCHHEIDLPGGQYVEPDLPELPDILPLYNLKRYVNLKRKTSYPVQIRVNGVVRTYEECFYEFPPGVGIPPEEIEEIPDEYDHWKRAWKVLPDKKFTEEEIKEEIEKKIDKICDYFHRYYTGNLTSKELNPKRPRNFFEVYLPTPDQVEFLKNLHIKVNWKLGLVHRYCYEFIYGTSASRAMAAHGIEWRKSNGLSRAEKEVILSNWIRFQKEYKFYDLRPLLTVKTLQLVRDGSEIDITNWQYISRRNFINFGLYLCRGLPERTPIQVLETIRKMMPYLDSNKYERSPKWITARDVAKMEYLIKRFGTNFSVMEIILGRFHHINFLQRFRQHIWFKKIKLRIGPWTEAEKNRLLIGLFSELDIKSLDDVLDMRAVPWNRILPYVRTRNYMNLKQRCHYMICKEKQRCGESFSNENRIKLIDWIYESDYREVAEINWQDVAVQFPDNTLAVIKDWFFNMYYSIPTKFKRSFEDSIEYLHKTVQKRHASLERLSTAAVSGASKCIKDQQKEDDIESVSDMESTDIDETPTWDDEIDSSECRGEGEDIQKSNSDRHTSMNIKLYHQRVCKNKDSNNDHYLDENQEKLLNCICKGNYKTLGNISWKEISRQFPGTTVSSVSAYFYRMYCAIPRRMRRNFNEGLEYLQKNVHRNSADLSGPTVPGKTKFSEGVDDRHQINDDFGWTDTDIDNPPAWDDELSCSESSDEDDLQESNLSAHTAAIK